jgi:large subunit ribosomal protein L15
MPLQRRLPKRGFNNIFRIEYSVVNLGQLDDRFEAGATVDIDALKGRGLVSGRSPRVKVLGMGELSTALTVRAHKFSASAEKAILAAGGTIEVLARA